MIPVEQVGPVLKQARLDQNKSIDELALATRINKKFLLEIEAGTAPALPDSYVQSFVKAYAGYVGVNLQELERKLETSAGSWHPGHPRPGTNEVDWLFDTARQPGTGNQQISLLITIGIGVIAAFVGFLFIINWTETRPVVEERRFAEVIAEHESTFAVPGFPLAHDSLGPSAASADSLRLEAMSTDTVWVRVVVDGGRIRESTLVPGKRENWRARESFVLSVSNGGAVQFVLDGKPLGVLGKPNRPLWNTIIDRSTRAKVPPKKSTS